MSDTAFLPMAVHNEYAKRMDDEHSRQNKRLSDLENKVEDIYSLTASVESLAKSVEQMAKAQEMKNMPRHKCAICGRTEKEFPDLEFRYCSKCEGNYEYCQDHLFTHEHVKNRMK